MKHASYFDHSHTQWCGASMLPEATNRAHKQAGPASGQQCQLIRPVSKSTAAAVQVVLCSSSAAEPYIREVL